MALTLFTKKRVVRVLDGREVLVGVIRDITALEEQRRQLSEAKEAAEAGSRAKSEFLARMSHEVRTSMNGVLGMTELLRATQLTTEQRGFVGTVHGSGVALLRIIDDILDFSKVEAGKLELVVALTANAMTGDREACIARGMDDYLSKPFTRAHLGALLERWTKPAAASIVTPQESTAA